MTELLRYCNARLVLVPVLHDPPTIIGENFRCCYDLLLIRNGSSPLRSDIKTREF